MRKILWIGLLWWGLGETLGAAQPVAVDRVAVEGVVTDAETGEPLPGAHVILAGTMVGTATDQAGRYQLTDVPPGRHRVYASMIGFAPARVDSLLRPGHRYTIDLSLTPQVIEMGTVTVEAAADPKWPKRLQRFTRMFIGESPFAEATVILNPEVLDFEGTWWGKLEARASAPLEIENQALGYRVRYFLEEFIHEGSSTRYDGEPLYAEMTPRDSLQAATWTENRRTAFLGSFHHYLLSLREGATTDAGFLSYRVPRFEERHRWRVRVRPHTLVTPGDPPENQVLRFSGLLEIIYARELEDRAYLGWAGTPGRSTTNQTSWIKLTDGPAAIDPYGELVDAYSITVMGYFAYEGLGDALPKEYRPAPMPR